MNRRRKAPLATGGGIMPVTDSGLASKEVKDLVARDREYGIWMEETPYSTRVPALPSGQLLYVEMGQAIADHFNQNAGLREALERMQTTGQRLLDDEHRR